MLILHVYEVVIATGLPNYIGALGQLPSNVCLCEWEALLCNAEDTITVHCLKLRFPVGYYGPIPTPTVSNHSSTLHHPHDVAAYITKEVSQGAMRGTYDALPFNPWCQVNALLMSPKKDIHLQRVVMTPPSQRHHQGLVPTPLDPGNWPLICLKAQGRYFIDVNLPVGLGWAAIYCQNITTLVVRVLKEEGINTLAYTDDFGGMAQDCDTVQCHFMWL